MAKEEIENINERLDSLDTKINTLETKMDKILNLLEENVNKNCQKMGEHIDFVENVYTNVKKPLEYVCGKVNQIASYTYINPNFSLED